MRAAVRAWNSVGHLLSEEKKMDGEYIKENTDSTGDRELVRRGIGTIAIRPRGKRESRKRETETHVVRIKMGARG
jgi:hypothetical protein